MPASDIADGGAGAGAAAGLLPEEADIARRCLAFEPSARPDCFALSPELDALYQSHLSAELSSPVMTPTLGPSVADDIAAGLNAGPLTLNTIGEHGGGQSNLPGASLPPPTFILPPTRHLNRVAWTESGNLTDVIPRPLGQ